MGKEATKGLNDLQLSILNRTRGLSLTQPASVQNGAAAEEEDTEIKQHSESEGVIARLKTEAARRLKDLEKAEDAADEALLKFGTNIRNFLRDAVTIAPPDSSDQGGTLLFESKDAQGRRAIHTTRFDAQIHVIHLSFDSFMNDPVSDEYESWEKDFNVDNKTDDISKDLERYQELKTAMEKLVPGQVAYGDFWKRYYFLRHSIETAEARRRDLLKGTCHDILVRVIMLTFRAAASTEEEVSWDEESDDEATGKAGAILLEKPTSVESSVTIQPPAPQAEDEPGFKASEPRRSNDEKSQTDSDGSYDVVGATSGVPSRAPGSPIEARRGDDSEEEDWE